MSLITKMLEYSEKMNDKRLYCLMVYISRYKEIKSQNNRLLSEFYIKWLIDEDKKVIFFNNPKVACTSLMVSIFKCTDVPDRDSLVQKHMFFSKNNIKQLPENLNDYYKFGFVRNPFSRLVSFYKNRYENNVLKDHKLKSNLGDYLKHVDSFDDLVVKISKIPGFMFDPHFSMQHPIFYQNGKCLVDFIGKFENIEADYSPIQQKYNFLPIPSYNQTKYSKNWQDYYTLKTAKLVYKIYKKDIELFGYHNDYEELIKFLNNKTKH